MMHVIVPATVGALASLAVAMLSAYLAARQQRRSALDVEHRLLRESYLNPLRFHLVENHFRLVDTVERVEAAGGRFAEVDVVSAPEEISSKSASWFTGEGARLTSAVYLSACLFVHTARVRDNVPYLRLTASVDTRLAELLLQVQIGFLKDRGIPYVLQNSIGHDLWHREDQRLRSYREFCDLLADPSTRVWFDPLIRVHLETGRGEKLYRIRVLLDAIEQLARFLDDCVSGGRSVTSRSNTERVARASYQRSLADPGVNLHTQQADRDTAR
ncbi:hypothetical protein ACLQ3B_32970 [Micromonospora sp. DT53]|uniref:hypothetical protein n=1 Tax=Micromonospora sp. DT53 TaxID=3393444 RepID=UPI003CF04A2E